MWTIRGFEMIIFMGQLKKDFSSISSKHFQIPSYEGQCDVSVQQIDDIQLSCHMVAARRYIFEIQIGQIQLCSSLSQTLSFLRCIGGIS